METSAVYSSLLSRHILLILLIIDTSCICSICILDCYFEIDNFFDMMTRVNFSSFVKTTKLSKATDSDSNSNVWYTHAIALSILMHLCSSYILVN
jgi:hypothetical protein